MSAGLRDLVADERVRLLSLRSTHVFLGCSFVVALAAAYLLCAKVNIRPDYRVAYRLVGDAFNEDTGSLLMAVAGCFAATSITGGYSTGLIRTTFTAILARGRVMLAKALASRPPRRSRASPPPPAVPDEAGTRPGGVHGRVPRLHRDRP